MSDKTPTFTRSEIQARVESLLKRMTLSEKIGQMTQADRRAIQPDELAHWTLGSVLSGGGSNPTPNRPRHWADMVAEFNEAALKTRLAIPLLYGVDAVHGHSNVVGATIFPHNIGLGAAGDADLVEEIGRATALELSATGVFWNFAPCVAVPQDIRWGRTYEGFSQDTELVTSLSAAYLTGLQGGGDFGSAGTVLACPKHFVADGGTFWGTTPRYDWLDNYWQAVDERYQIDQGDARIDEATLLRVHMPPYRQAIVAGARSIMVSFSSWNGVKLHAHHQLLTNELKGRMGFTGFLVSDWQAINQLSPDYEECVVRSINAGLDMIMAPFDYQHFISALTGAVATGHVLPDRIDDAVRRILTVKYELGLFERQMEAEPSIEVVGSHEHRELARKAVRNSLVLLQNERQALPVSRNVTRLLVAGEAADNIGLQCGGWTVEWLGGTGPITPGTTLLEAIRETMPAGATVHYQESGHFPDDLEAEVGIVCLHELPYAEGVGDRADLSLSADEAGLLQRVRTKCQRLVVIIFSGRPLIITDQLSLADAWVAAWLPGSEGAGVTDVLFGDFPFTGRLSYDWPAATADLPLGQTGATPLFPRGFGLTTE